MDKKLRHFKKALLGTATLSLLWVPSPVFGQSTSTQDRQAVQAAQTDDITRRDLARFDQFLDSHHEIAGQLRRTPALIDDPQFLQSHPELSAYLQDHPSVKQEISQQPDTFMRLEDRYDRDSNLRDRDAGGQDRDGIRRDAADDRDRDDRDGRDRGEQRRDIASFDRFLDSHREIAEQVRKDPSLVDNREFVQNHPALQSYLRQNPDVRELLQRDPNAFMRRQDADGRGQNMGDRGTDTTVRDPERAGLASDRDSSGQERNADRRDDRGAVGQDRDADRRDDRDAGRQDRDDHRRDVESFDRFLDSHREIGEQVRRNPSLVDNREFVQNHPALQDYLRQNPDVRDQLRQNPNIFTQQASLDRHDWNMRDRDPVDDRMADFGGFLGSHSEIKRDLARNPSVVKDHDYVQNHAELNTYLNTHPDVRAELMSNPKSFIQGAQQYNSSAGTGAGAGVTGRGTGTTGSISGSSTGTTSTTRPTTPPKPNQ